MWLDVAIAISCGGGGIVCGWIMHSIGAFSGERSQPLPSEPLGAEPTQEKINSVAGKLREYASAMAADVDAHQTRVQEVSNSLLDCGEDPDEIVQAIEQLVTANVTMQQQLQSAQDRIQEQSLQIETAERRAYTDGLTRVSNRRALDEHLEQRHLLDGSQPTTLALIDVDHFKRFNDVHGHRAGDEVLKVVAMMLQARLQDCGLVARYGGEEFAIVIDGKTVSESLEVLESTRELIGNRDIQFEDKHLRVTACMGVAELLPSESVERWIQRADDCLYQSKEAGRNCGHWMDRSVPKRIGVAEELGEKAPQPKTKTFVSSPTPKKDVDPTPTKETRRAFAYLADREHMSSGFGEISRRAHAVGTSVFVMAIRFNSEASKTAMCSLLQIVRSTMRSIDRVGCDDESTLLLYLPSVDEETTMERAMQICRAAEAIRLGELAWSQTNQVCIGITQANADETFDDVVSRAIDVAVQAQQEGVDPIRINKPRLVV